MFQGPVPSGKKKVRKILKSENITSMVTPIKILGIDGVTNS